MRKLCTTDATETNRTDFVFFRIRGESGLEGVRTYIYILYIYLGKAYKVAERKRETVEKSK